jgi:Tol biopolymer transport system component
MTARVPWIGRLAFSLAALVAGGGCAVPEYNQNVTTSEAAVLTDVTQLTRPSAVDGFDRAGGGRFSPDGRWVVFRGVPHGTPPAVPPAYGLFLAHVRWSTDGERSVVALERPLRITRPGVRCGGASFSPDGFTLVFAAARPDAPKGPMQLFRVDGWEQDVAMADVARGVDLAQHAVSPPDLSADESDWSPVRLYAMRPDGSHLVRLGPPFGYARGPAFAPDGHRLLYRGDAAGSPYSQVLIADLAFDVNHDPIGLIDPQPLTHEAGVTSSGPCWLSGGTDGLHILYATTRHGDRNAELYVMDDAGLRKTRLTLTPGPDLLPSVTADGRHLLWTRSGSPEGAPQLFAANLQLPPGS